MTGSQHSTTSLSSTRIPAPLVYEGEIIHDRGDMLSLTDMWRAARSPEDRRPAEWLRSADARRFMDFLAESLNMGNSHIELVSTARGGASPGSWAHWQVALAYAKYLSPEFHVWCNSVVRRRMQYLNEPGGYAILPVAQVAGASEVVFKSYFGIAQTIGLDINQSALAANRATKSLTGQNPLQLLGCEQLEAPRQEQHLTPTDLARLLNLPSPRAVNRILEDLGLQRSIRDAKGRQYWEPTAEGKAFGVMLDTNKKHSDGTPVCQLKWRTGVVEQLKAASADAS